MCICHISKNIAAGRVRAWATKRDSAYIAGKNRTRQKSIVSLVNLGVG